MDKTGFSIITTHLVEFNRLLIDVAQQLNVEIDADQRSKLLLYLDKLLFWNKAYNLTAIKAPKEALVKHIVDCLSILPHLSEGSLLDIGTGAGLPGVVVAICQPSRDVTVLDSNQKKIRFIKQLVSDLGVSNVRPVASRIEAFELDDTEKFDVVTSRAFASLSDFVAAASPKVSSSGCLQAMKGLKPNSDETEQLSEDWTIKCIELTVPMLNETRHLVNLTPKV